LIAVQNLVVVSHILCAREQQVPKIFREPKPLRPLGCGEADPLETRPYPDVLTYQIWSLWVKPFGRRWGLPKTRRTLGPSPPLRTGCGTLRNTLLRTFVITPNFVA